MVRSVASYLFLLVSAFLASRYSDVQAAVAKNSSPFDPFRLECPFFHGIVRLDLQRVESSEGVRTDTMITSFCENIKKLYPSPRDPTLTTADENCRWTDNFKVPGESFHFTDTCNGREFVSGISRQSPGEYGILCCKIKDRKKGECNTVEFRLPTVETPAVEVERGKRILTGLGHENGRMVAQFCDMQVMSKKEVDEEFIANARAQLLAQGEDKVANPDEKEDGPAGSPTKSALTKATGATKAPSRLSSPGLRPPSGFVPSRVDRPSASTVDDGATDDDDKVTPKISENDIARLAVIKNAISAPAGNKPPGRVPPNGSRVTTVSRVRTTKTSTAEETEETTEAATRSRKPSTTTEGIETTEESQTESETQDEEQTSTKQTSKATDKTSTNEPTLKTTTLGDISPDPAHFQVLGIPRPASSGSAAANPSANFIRPSPKTDQSDDPDTTSTSAVITTVGDEETSRVTLPTIEPDDGETSTSTASDTEEETTTAADEKSTKGKKKNDSNDSGAKRPKPTTSSPKSKTSRTEKPKSNKLKTPKSDEEEFPQPASSNFGNVSAISNGIVLSAQNSIESAVAPAKPQFTILPRPPKFDNKNPAIGKSPSAETQSTTTTTAASTTTTSSRLECHTNTAWRDPISNLVVACGQGDDIWVPSRCQAGLLCLLGKDSSYRLCCSVRV